MYTPKPYADGYLAEQDGHRVYYALYGNPEGATVISCHGGPGSQSKAKHAAQFDLERYRVVLFDQRGCGKSEPMGRIEYNATTDLIADIERIRTELAAEQWFVAGSSWGATLALTYAELYPDRTRGLLLSAIFLGDEASETWIRWDREGVAPLFPDGAAEVATRLQDLGIATESDIFASLYRCIISDDTSVQQRVAALMGNWEGNLLARTIPTSYTRPEEVTEADIAAATIFLHYLSNHFWLEPDQLLRDATKLTHVPAVLVHGRYDILCPLRSAWDLHTKLPQSTFVPLPESHHAIQGDGAMARYYAFQLFLRTYVA